MKSGMITEKDKTKSWVQRLITKKAKNFTFDINLNNRDRLIDDYIDSFVKQRLSTPVYNESLKESDMETNTESKMMAGINAVRITMTGVINSEIRTVIGVGHRIVISDGFFFYHDYITDGTIAFPVSNIKMIEFGVYYKNNEEFINTVAIP